MGARAVFESERALLVFLTIFILIPIFVWIKKESNYPLLSLVIFIGMGMWNASIGIFRQWCAIAILTIPINILKQEDSSHFDGGINCNAISSDSGNFFIGIFC